MTNSAINEIASWFDEEQRKLAEIEPLGSLPRNAEGKRVTRKNQDINKGNQKNVRFDFASHCFNCFYSQPVNSPTLKRSVPSNLILFNSPLSYFFV